MKDIKVNMYNNKWMGNDISKYGLEHGYIDYRCLAEAVGNMMLCNDITKLFYSTVNGSYIEPEQENGYIDNSEEIEKLEEQIEKLEDELDVMDLQYNPDDKEYIITESKILDLKEEIERLEEEQDTQKDIYQYYIISYYGAELLKQYTDEIVYYIEELDMYIWGITHCGTSWDYGLTDIKINKPEG